MGANMTRYIYDPAIANTVGVLGVIPVVLGGTGANTADNAAANLGFVKTSSKNQANGVAGLDGDGKVSVANLPSSINSASEAAKLTTARSISLSGDASGTVNFDGSANVSITVTVADDSHFHTFDNITATPTSLAGYGITDGVNTSDKGAANGVATLDSSGLVPTTQLPSYVDDVLEFANLASFPGTGTAGKIYVALDTNKCYRWSGSAYIFITSGAVDSVMGSTGVITATDLGLQNFTAGATVSGTHSGSSSGTNTGDQTITLTGDATGSGTGSFAVTLANSGATAGTYKSVTINAKGLVTDGTNPTTLSGYGITDAIPSTAKGANSGVAELDDKGVLKSSHLPFAAIMFLMAPM